MQHFNHPIKNHYFEVNQYSGKLLSIILPNLFTYDGEYKEGSPYIICHKSEYYDSNLPHFDFAGAFDPPMEDQFERVDAIDFLKEYITEYASYPELFEMFRQAILCRKYNSNW